MVPSFSKVHNKFKLNRTYFSHAQLNDVAYSFIKEGDSFEKSIGDFLLDWLDDKDFILVKTSGSTGKPKAITLKKQAMVNSAIATGNFFNLTPGSKALLCLPTEFIAGKMMLIRAIILGLELDIIAPSLYPLASIEKSYDFCAMVPMQLQNSLAELYKVKTLIVGGGTVSLSLHNKLQEVSTRVYETYGMTETMTHIAVRPLNHVESVDGSACFKTLPNIVIAQDERGCLIVKAPHLNIESIITNDLVKLHTDNEFKILGRFDNMINSGGLKLFPEQIEAKLSSKIKQRFFIASEKDEVLGDKLILVLEGESKKIETNVLDVLNKYETPKQIYAVKHFIETSTGKVKRLETLKSIK